LSRSALYISVQLISMVRPFSQSDEQWIKKIAKVLNISEQEQMALTKLSLIDHIYTPFGPKAEISKATFDQIMKDLNHVEEQLNAVYFSNARVVPGARG
jgi:hypothetical protein